MILRISFILILLLFLPTWYLFHAHMKEKKLIWRILFWLPNTFLFIATVLLSLFRQFSYDQAALTGFYLMLVLYLCIPETLYALFLFVGRRFSNKNIRLLFSSIGLLFSITSLVVLLWGHWQGNRKITTPHFDYRSERIPAAFDGYKIVQFSDLHIGTFRNNPAFIDKVVDAINRQHADLIVFTGDMVNFRSEELLPHMSRLQKLHARDGIVSVLGNHDYMAYVRWPSMRHQTADTQVLVSLQESMGWRVLRNENLSIKRQNDSIFIAGSENDGRPPFPQRGDLKSTLRGIPANGFTVLLSHDPTHWKRKVLPETDVALTLSGHTHGMQFKIGDFSPASFFFDEWGGHYDEQGRSLLVSLGIGEVLLPYRFGAWPEINIITLKKQ